ncbi:helix-turn-helix domain-containing protein [Bacillus sp. B-jedd]|uniref:helix-turn-helix domain-containing protein n=1 Tax=Bacillus sp. B-jedd TaxID=1476857 RepID=UPI000515604E|nr:helix-turn-helix domain-containing protein [Bacillus sp. B-jedd]CEG25686.1 AraC family transcriptional regulator [Bacillus sp. B-jedd]
MINQSNKSAIIREYFETRLKNQQNYFIHPSYALEQQLMDCIGRGEEEEAKAVLDQINSNERAKLAEEPIRSLKNSLICSCTLFTRSIIKAGVPPEDAFNLSDVYIRQIEKLNSPNEIKALEYEMISSFIDTLKSANRPYYNNIINKAIDYINQGIFQDLSLETIAGHVGVTPSYLSMLFKESVGMPISQFINHRRVEESKYFLLHSKLSLSEIAHLLGYCNQSYYTHLFKKYIGVTPKHFRSNPALDGLHSLVDQKNRVVIP